MSYNRGRGYRQQQDGRQSYRSGMTQHSNQRGSLNVSPWECGVAPNAAALSRASLQSLLPSPPQLQASSNILSQQQHALVMASNLLSNLGLLPQQQQQQHRSQELPSLMNVRTLGNSSSFRLPPQNYNSHGSGRYSGSAPHMRRNKPLESHRVEPYNKNRGRPAQAQQSGQRRFPTGKPATGNKPAVVTAGNAKSKKLAAKAVTAPTQAGEAVGVKSEPVEAKSDSEVVTVKLEEDNEAKSLDMDEDESKKRDWKAEKPGDLEGAAMEVDQKMPGKETEVAEGDEEDPTEKAEDAANGKAKTGKFHCHVCNRYLQDEQGLKNHLSLKSHGTKMNRLDASYKAKAEEMRAAMKKAVQRQEVNMQRQGGGKKPTAGRDYCKMCDLNFYGTIVGHRKNEAHLQLKTFLHPRCGTCSREFPTRMEWDLHKLTISHQNRERKREDSRPPTSPGVHSVKGPATDSNGHPASGERTPRGAGKVAMSVDAVYDPLVPVGLEFLATGQHCRVCQLFFERRYDAKQHCMTQDHFAVCLAKAKEAAEAEIQRLQKEAAEKAAAKENAAEEPALTGTTTPADTSEVKAEPEVLEVEPDQGETEPGTDDDEGNWKRRRVADASAAEMKPPAAVSASLSAVGGEPYNPLEVADDDDITEISPLVDAAGDCILAALDREIGEVLESAANDETNGVKDDEADDKPKAGSRARRGGRGGTPRGRKRKC